jgi:hypothetical protein
MPREVASGFAGDAATNVLRLGVGPVYEEVDEGRRRLRRLSALEFETALFAHRRPLGPRASGPFRALRRLTVRRRAGSPRRSLCPRIIR